MPVKVYESHILLNIPQFPKEEKKIKPSSQSYMWLHKLQEMATKLHQINHCHLKKGSTLRYSKIGG